MSKHVVKTNRLMKPIAHFSFGVRIADDVQIGATAGTDATRRLAGSTPGLADMRAQAEQMFENFAISLEVLGARLDHTVAIRSYITDWRDLEAYSAAYDRWIGNRPVCHVILGTPGFPLPQATVEAELIASIGPSSRKFLLASSADAIGTTGPSRDITAQSERALRSLQDQLHALQLRPADVVFLNIALADIRHLPLFDAVYARFFGPPFPARTVTAAFSPCPDALVQIDAIGAPGGGQGFSSPHAWADAFASSAVRAGEYVYVGGQLGHDVHGPLQSTVEGQARAAWQRIESILNAAGMDLDQVVHSTNVLTDWRSYAGFNTGYGAFARAPYPPRATVIAGLAHPAALVQIDALGHARGRDATFIEVEP